MSNWTTESNDILAVSSGIDEYTEMLAGIAKSFASTEFKLRLQNELGKAVVELVQLGFDLQQDPWGSPWAAHRKATRNKGLILIASGHLREGISFRVISNAIVITSKEAYTRFHQNGSKYMARRSIFPRPGDPLPADYEAAMNAAADNVVGKMMNRLSNLRNF